MDIKELTTENRNEKTVNLDKMTALEICTSMNEEDKLVPGAIADVLPTIAAGVDMCAEALKKGGRMIYIGAGTSGRMGLMDAVECVPTFGVTDDVVIGLIAGGEAAFIKAVEGAEDSEQLGVADVKQLNINNKDVLIGIAASGRTPYVISALDYARSIGVNTISISCNKNAKMSAHADLAIEVDAGNEVLTGSTRLKAGSVQKMVLNMLSTGAMVLNGKVYKNLMVDVLMTNEKLQLRGRNIIMEATGVDFATADKYLKAAHNKPKIAIVMILKKYNYDEAKQALEQAGGFVRKTL